MYDKKTININRANITILPHVPFGIDLTLLMIAGLPADNP